MQGKKAQLRHQNYLLVFFLCIFIITMTTHGVAKNTSDIILGALSTLIYLILPSS